MIVNPDGTVDQLCADQRTANRAQRRQLAAMYSTFAHPHCHVAFSNCRIHHIIWWTRGGKTVLANLLPLRRAASARCRARPSGEWDADQQGDHRQGIWVRRRIVKARFRWE